MGAVGDENQLAFSAMAGAQSAVLPVAARRLLEAALKRSNKTRRVFVTRQVRDLLHAQVAPREELCGSLQLLLSEYMPETCSGLLLEDVLQV